MPIREIKIELTLRVFGMDRKLISEPSITWATLDDIPLAAIECAEAQASICVADKHLGYHLLGKIPSLRDPRICSGVCASPSALPAAVEKSAKALAMALGAAEEEAGVIEKISDKAEEVIDQAAIAGRMAQQISSAIHQLLPPNKITPPSPRPPIPAPVSAPLPPFDIGSLVTGIVRNLINNPSVTDIVKNSIASQIGK